MIQTRHVSKLLRIMLILLLITVAFAQDEDQYQDEQYEQEKYQEGEQQDAQPLDPAESKANQIRQREQQLRNDNNMTYTNMQTYTFMCGRFDDFMIKPSIDELIKVEVHLYWRKDNVYVTSQYEQGEQVRVMVLQNNQFAVLDRQFYMMTGFSFQAKKGITYTLRFLAAGRVIKLASMYISLPLMRSQQGLTTKKHVDTFRDKVDRIGNQLKAMFAISQRNEIMVQKMAEKILSSTKIYMAYEVFETIVILGVAVLQITSLTKLLKGGSIV